MRIYIDSVDLVDVREALASGYVYGVTTNPTLLRRAGVQAAGVPDLVREVLALGAKEIHLQTYSDNVETIVEEAGILARLDPERVVVKIPATAVGYSAAARLVEMGLRVTLTAVYSVRQAVLADAVGVRYIAVYLGRMSDQGLDALGVVGKMQRALDMQGSAVDILAASVRAPEEVETLAEIGVATATLPLKVLRLLPEAEATNSAARAFLEDAQAIQ